MTDLFDSPIPRDRWGRPLVTVPDGTRRVAYRRVTTFVGALEDTYNLMRWKQRQTALGLAARNDLYTGVVAAEPTDKKTLDALCEQAVDAAQSSAKATIGTALHSFTEQLDRGQTIPHIPHPYEGDLAAYQKAVAGMEILAIEQFRVFDSWEVAGTADRLVRFRDGTFIADIKTGDIDWGALKISMQLACYAHATPYVNDKRVEDKTPVDLKRGLVIHLPAGAGRCDLHWVDIEKGWAACQVAFKVWEARGMKKDLMWPVTGNELNAKLESDLAKVGGKVSAALEKVRNAETVDELRQLWTRSANEGTLDQGLAEAILARRDQLSQ